MEVERVISSQIKCTLGERGGEVFENKQEQTRVRGVQNSGILSEHTF